jgi:copper(I)-binding protein
MPTTRTDTRTATVMDAHPARHRRTGLRLGAAAIIAAGLGIALPGLVFAHGSQVGDIAIEHPYAVPTPPAARTGAVYFRAINNEGKADDRLRSASTPIARTVEFHEMTMSGDVMRMRAMPAIELPAGQSVPLRHGGTLHIMLVDLKQPLKNGDRFPVTLEFERAGRKEVMVWVQTPREAAKPEAAHAHPTEHTH